MHKLLKTCLNLLKNDFFSSKKPTRSYSVAVPHAHRSDFPDKLIKKKVRNPPSLYIAHEAAARILHSEITCHLEKLNRFPKVFYEINPGKLFLTKLFLDAKDSKSPESQDRDRMKHILVEALDEFLPKAEELQLRYPDRVKVYHKDFINIWKILYQDKMDNGSRVSDLLVDMPKQPFEEEPSTAIFAGVGSYNFFKHIINSIVFQTSFLSYGRCDMFFVVPPPIYIHLTCNKDIGYLLYRATTILFQIFFEYKFLKKIPRNFFLPNPTVPNLSKEKKLARINSINTECLYLVHIVPRQNIHELCAQEDLQALWYFVKQNCVSRKNRVIPNIEKFVPGCGPRLILSSPENTNHLNMTYPNEKRSSLPKYSVPSYELSNQNHYANINIFTEFGDLNPSQMISLFSEFRSWPEYALSPFLASLENCLLKLETTEDQDVNDDQNERGIPNIQDKDDID